MAGFGTVAYAPGVVGQAFVFDGTHRDRVDMGNAASLQLQQFTIEAWIKRSSPTVIAVDILGVDGSQCGEGGMVFSYGRNGYGLGLLHNGRLLVSKIDVDGVFSTGAVTDTNWHHVAVTKSGSTAMFYIDGAPASGAIPYTTTYTFDTSAAVGSRGDARGGTFLGSIDEPSVYGRALSAAEIQTIYNAGTNSKCPLPPSFLTQPASRTVTVGNTATFTATVGGAPLISYRWFFNGAPLTDGGRFTGSTTASLNIANAQMNDAGSYQLVASNAVASVASSNAVLTVNPPPPCAPAPSGLVGWWRGENSTTDAGDGNHGTWAGFGNTNTYGPGVVGQAFVFDGTHRDRVNLGNPPNLRLEDFTIEAWVKRSSPSVTSFDVLGADGSVAGDGAMILGYGRGGYGLALANNGRMILTRTDLDGIFSAPLITDTNWHHLAVTKAGTNAVFYLDGVPQATPAYVHPAPYTFDDATCTCSAAVSIGSRGDGRGGTFFGMIDEPAIFNRALMASEIQAIYAADGAGKCVATNPPPACTTAASGLVSWWRAETNALDAADGNHGTLAGNVTFGPGRVGQCFVLDGNRNGVNVGTGANLRLQDFTIEAWIRRANAIRATQDPANINGCILSYGHNGYGFTLLDDGRLDITQVDIGGVFSSALRITDTNFHHVALTKSGATIVFYVDGVGETAAPYDPGFSFTTPATIGARGDNLTSGFWGAIDELAAFNRALPATEIQSIYAAGSTGKCVVSNPPPPACVTPAPGLLSWWRAEGNALDSADGNHGTPNSATPFSPAGISGQAFKFNGLADKLDLGDPPSLRLTNSFTIEGWILASNAPTGPHSQILFRGDTRHCLDPYYFSLQPSRAIRLHVAANEVLVNPCGVDLESAPVPLNQWLHVAGVFDGDAGSMSIYIDGVLAAQMTTSVKPFAELDPAYTPAVVIGNTIGFTDQGFNGLLDELAVYNRALTAVEIQAIHAAGSAGKCVPPPPPWLLAGPITNAASGHWYYLLAATNWPAAEEIAVSLGGHLATINNAAENNWVFTNFGNYGGVERALWLGLNDSAQENIWVWVSGQPATYFNWAPGEPNSGGGFFPDEDHVLIWHPSSGFPLGSWADAPSNQLHSAVVEVSPPEPIVLAGPITNAANGHWYYLLNFTNWPAAEQVAVSLGGHLATINDAAENAWIFNTFSTYGGIERPLWIGLNDSAQEGNWVWVSGQPVTYLNWAPGEPNSGGGYFPDEDHALIWHPSSGFPSAHGTTRHPTNYITPSSKSGSRRPSSSRRRRTSPSLPARAPGSASLPRGMHR